MPRTEDYVPPEAEEEGAPAGPPRKRGIMDERLEAYQQRRLGEVEPAAAVMVLPPFVLAFIALVIVGLAALGIAMALSGSSEPQQEDGAEVANVEQQITLPPAPTQAPAATAMPTPVGIALAHIGVVQAMENKVVMDCSGRQLVYSIMLRKRAEDQRLEVTLQTNVGSNAIDAIHKGSTGTILVPGTTCGMAIAWDGTSSTYTAVGP